MRDARLWVRLSTLLLLASLLLIGSGTLAAAASTGSVAQPSLLPAPEGGTPDKAPATAAISEAEAEKPGNSPLQDSDGGATGTPFRAPRASSAQLFAQASRTTARCLTTVRGYVYPRDPCLRLNPGHAPPRG